MTPSFPYLSTGYTAGSGWRPLRKRDPLQSGWDVFDLQCKLNLADVANLDTDGVFGTFTDAAVRSFQKGHGLTVDGIAGVATQVELGRVCCYQSELPKRVLGQVQKESSLLCGIYTAPYQDGSRDRGPVQENSKYWPEVPSFDARQALPALVARIKKEHAKYVGWGVEDRRAWAAAQGHWNSPAWADSYARGQQVPQSFLDYVAAVTIYA